MKSNTARRILSALDAQPLEAVPVPHDEPAEVIPDPQAPPPDPLDAPEVEDSLVDEVEPHSEVQNTGPEVPRDGGLPEDRDQVQEYSTKTTDVTGKPALDAEELDEINSMLGTATFSFGDTTYDAIRLGGSWYIKGEKPEEGDGADSDSQEEDSDEPSEEDSDEAPGEADNESPAEAEEGDEEAEEEAQEEPEDDGEAGSDESEETAARIHAYLDSRFGHLRPPRNLTEADYDAWVKRRTVTAELGPSSEESLFFGAPNAPELTGVGSGMTEESIKPDLAPSFAITRDRLEPGDPEMEGNENPSQVGVQAPGITSSKVGARDYSRSHLRGHIKPGSAFAVEHRRAELASRERECIIDAVRLLRAHYGEAEAHFKE